jgi:hypothetical protein
MSAEHTYKLETSYAAYVTEALRLPIALSVLAGVGVKWVDDDYWQVSLTIPVNLIDDAAGYDVSTHEALSAGELTVSRLPPIGWPILLTPLSGFGPNSPYQLKATINIPPERKSKTGAQVTLHEAWVCAWALRLCGFDQPVRGAERVGPQRFFASNENSWTHPIWLSAEARHDPVMIGPSVRREHVFVELPQFQTKMWNEPIDFEVQLWTHGVSAPGTREYQAIYDGGTKGVAPVGEVRIAAPEGTLRLRAYLQRDAQNFHFVGSVEAGVIPTTGEAQPVAVVEE